MGLLLMIKYMEVVKLKLLEDKNMGMFEGLRTNYFLDFSASIYSF